MASMAFIRLYCFSLLQNVTHGIWPVLFFCKQNATFLSYKKTLFLVQFLKHVISSIEHQYFLSYSSFLTVPIVECYAQAEFVL